MAKSKLELAVARFEKALTKYAANEITHEKLTSASEAAYRAYNKDFSEPNERETLYQRFMVARSGIASATEKAREVRQAARKAEIAAIEDNGIYYVSGLGYTRNNRLID